jgi:hypothetical protein
MYLVMNKCVTAVKVSNFSGHYLRNRSTLGPPEVWHIPPGTPVHSANVVRIGYNGLGNGTH